MHKTAFARDLSYLAPKGLTIAPHLGMKMRAFCGCYDHQMIPSVRFRITSNIKTLASTTPRISAMSTSAVLFFVIWYHVPLVFPATRVISRDISKTPERRKADKLTTLKTSRRLGETPNTWRYEWRNHTSLSLLKCSKQGNISWAAACSNTMNGLQGSPLVLVTKELAHL